MRQLELLASKHQGKPSLGKENQLVHKFLQVVLITKQHLRADIHNLLLLCVSDAEDLLAVVRVDHLPPVHSDFALRDCIVRGVLRRKSVMGA